MLIDLKDWDTVIDWLDDQPYKPTARMIENINQGRYPKDAFSLGQMASKTWLIKELANIASMPDHSTIALLGCWIGGLVPLLHKEFVIDRIYGIDLDPRSVSLSEEFNQCYVQDGWRYKGVVHDIDLLNMGSLEFVTSGELINVIPDIIINTSCEHMSTHWFESANDRQLIVMQTNDREDYEGHINTCPSLEEMKTKYSLSNILYCGELKMPAYSRFMQIGYK